MVKRWITSKDIYEFTEAHEKKVLETQVVIP